MFNPISTGCDLMCMYCGRPVLGTTVWGASGPYHPECCGGNPPPMESQKSFYDAYRFDRIAEALEEIARLLKEKHL